MECDCIPPPPPLFDLPPPPNPSLIWHLLSPSGDEDGVVDGKVLFDTCDAALKKGAEGTWPFNILTSPSFPHSPGELWSRSDAVHLLLTALFLALLVGCLTATCVLRRRRLRQRRKHSTPSPSSLESSKSKCSTKTVATAANTTATRIVDRLSEQACFPPNFSARQLTQLAQQQQHFCHPSASSATFARRVFAVPIRCGHHPTALNYPSSYALSGSGNAYGGGSQRRTAVRMYGSQSSTNIFTNGMGSASAAVECVHCSHAPAPYVQPVSYHLQHGNPVGPSRMIYPQTPSCCGSTCVAGNQGYCTLLTGGGQAPSATELYEEISTGSHCCHHQHCPDSLPHSPPMVLRMPHPPQWARMHGDCHDIDNDGDELGECNDDGPSPTVFEHLSESIRRAEEADRLHAARRPPPPGPPPPPPPLQSLRAEAEFNSQPGYSVPPTATVNQAGSLDSLEAGVGEHNSSSVGRPSSGDTELERLAGNSAPAGKQDDHHPVPSFGGSPPIQANGGAGQLQLERSPLSTGSANGCGGRESGYGTGGNRHQQVARKSQLQSSSVLLQSTPPIPQRRARPDFPSRAEPHHSEEIPLQLSPPTRAELPSNEGTGEGQQPEAGSGGQVKNRSITYV